MVGLLGDCSCLVGSYVVGIRLVESLSVILTIYSKKEVKPISRAMDQLQKKPSKKSFKDSSIDLKGPNLNRRLKINGKINFILLIYCQRCLPGASRWSAWPS